MRKRSRTLTRRIVVLAVAVAAITGWTMIEASIASATPPQTMSYYVTSNSTSTLQSWGCNAPANSGAIVVDFGRPAYRSSDSAYGTIDWVGSSGTFIPNGTIQGLIEAFAKGWYNCHSGNVVIIRALSNCSVNSVDPNCPAHTSYDVPSWITAAQKWAAYTTSFGDYLSSSGYSSRETPAAGIDAEPDYDTVYTHTRNFVGTYNSNGSTWMYDFGAPYSDYWSYEDMYTIAYGVLLDFPYAEVYNTDFATDWYHISSWGASNGDYGAMYFEGVMCTTSGLGCSSAYSALVSALSNSSSTAQSSIPYLTKIYFP